MKFRFEGNKTKFFAGTGGLLLSLLAWHLVPGGPSSPEAPGNANMMAAIVALMAVWWVFEVVPIAVTSLFPIIFMPAFGIATVEDVTSNYANSTIYLFLGGFMLAMALQESMVHRRIALHVVKIIGSTPSRLILGFMVATGFISMWVSNMATVMVIMPIGMSILEEIKNSGGSESLFKKFAAALMLCICYAADMGGLATLVGTAPNMIYKQMVTDIFPDAPPTEFLDWMIMGTPLCIIFIFSGWLLLTRVIYRFGKEQFLGNTQAVENQIRSLGKIRRDEIFAVSVFGFAVFLWITGSPVGIGGCTFIGWREFFGLEPVTDAVVAVSSACLLFLIPSKDRRGEMLMDWKTAVKVPWGILILFGGGFAIAAGFESSGLSEIIGEQIAGTEIKSPVLMILFICLIITFLTEFTSNTALTMLILPILAKVSVVMGYDPRMLMIPATLAASCGFMMPVSSPTHAIIFGSGYLPIRHMIRAGIYFDILGILLVTIIFWIVGPLFMGIDFSNLPAWAK